MSTENSTNFVPQESSNPTTTFTSSQPTSSFSWWWIGLIVVILILIALCILASVAFIYDKERFDQVTSMLPSTTSTINSTSTITTVTSPVTTPASFIFQEEFTTPQLNPKFWNVITSGNGDGNYIAAYYVPSAVSTIPAPGKGLTLTISPIVNAAGSNVADLTKYQAYDIGAPNPSEPYKSQRYYFSGKVTTQGKFSFQYGRVDCRIKLPPGDSSWSAFWLLPELQTATTASNTWPNYGEIDIMEAFGVNFAKQGGNNTVYGSLNYGTSWNNAHYVNNSYKLPNGAQFSDDFHIFSIVWTVGKIEYYVDNILYSTQTPASFAACGNPLPNIGCNCDANNTPCAWPFDIPGNKFYLIINNAIGGTMGNINVPPLDQLATNGNNYNAINPTAPNYISRTPQPMIIDYVHISSFSSP